MLSFEEYTRRRFDEDSDSKNRIKLSEPTKKKKKKDSDSIAGMSFGEYTKMVLGDDDENNVLAPLPFDVERERAGSVFGSVNTGVGNSGGGGGRSFGIEAPTKEKKEKEEKERTWFNKGSFDDGILKGFAGSTKDLTQNILTGTAGMIEKAVDALAYLAPAMTVSQQSQNTNAYQFDIEEYRKMQKTSADFMKKDLYDEEKLVKSLTYSPAVEKFGIDTEKHSVFGEKSDALAQSAGQLGGTIALQAVGVPWWLTTGTTSFGSEAENALKQGATYEQAGGSALISAGAEILTEKLSGGIKFGGKTLDDVTIKPLTEMIADKTLKNLANIGIDATGEGAEEVISSVISNLGTSLYKEESIEELLTSEEALDEYIESFIGGAFLGGSMSTVNTVVEERASKKEATENLITENEQKVIDKEVEKRTKDQELSEKEIKEIRKEVERDLETGQLDIDTIESAIGGETYEAYNSIIEQEESLKKEIEGLKTDPRPQAQTRRAEAEAELKAIVEGTEKTELKNRLSLEVEEIAKADRLGETYNERARRSQVFEADLSKYDKKAQETVKKAVESGILNNTNRTHEFVDMIAKLSAEKGVSFDFTNNENLKKSGFSIEGATINGLVKGNEVILNTDSRKALNSVVGHEVTHVLEGTDMYSELQTAIFEYAKSKGEFDTRLETVEKLYNGQFEGTEEEIRAKLDKELTADLVGDYLFTDSDFINSLSTQKPNVFKKIYEEIKYLYKLATAGSKEARQLEKVKKAFDNIYSQTQAKGVAISEELATQEAVPTEEAKPIIGEVTPIIEKAEKVSMKLTEEQEAFFEKAVTRDENGNLKPMYHGTSKGGHTVFDTYGASKYGLFGVGTYFTDDRSVAESYTEKGKGKNKQVYETYLNITNPIDMDAQASPEAWKKAMPEANFPESGTNEDFYRAMEEYLADNEYAKWEASEIALETLESMGYDGITHIGGGRFNKADDTRHQVYIAFHSEQIKNIDNASPTTDPDIRYSLSEEGKIVDDKGNEIKLETIEAGTHNSLMAIHNLSAEKINGILELGGFPVPSIAIIDESNVGNLSYGDISVLLDKSSIDPKNKKNEVYGSDVYSKRFPQTVQEVSDKELSKLEEYLGKRLDLEDTTLERAKSKYSYDQDFVDKFLQENNINVEDVYKEVGYNYTFGNHEKTRQFVIENDITFDKLLNNEELRNEFYELFRESSPSFTGFTEKKIARFKQAFSEGVETDFGTSVKNRLDKDFHSIKNGAEKAVDTSATNALKRNTVLNEYGEQYDNFLNNLLSPVFGEKYLRNNKDLYTPSGNRRSFKQLYEPYTLDNIMKNMLGKVRGEEGFFYGAGNIRSNVSQKFNSIADIKKNADKLISSEEFKQVKEQINEKLNSLISEANQYGGHNFDSYANALNDVSKLNTITPERAKTVFKDYGFDMPDSMIQKSVAFLDELKKAPTEYFEAKPQRVISFDEVQAVVIPNSTNTDLKKKLSNAGFYVVEYDSNIEGDRANKINQFDNLKFSLSENKQNIAPVGKYQVYGKDIALQKPTVATEEVAPTQETVPTQEAVVDEYAPLTETEANERDAMQGDRLYSLNENDMPEEVEAPYSEPVETESPFDERDIKDVGDRKQKAYMYENPEVKPYFQEEARNMLYELGNSIKGEKHFNDQLYYDTNGEQGWFGTTRETSEQIAYLLDNFNYTYADIEKGLKAIIEDHGAENIAVAKRIEFMLDERLREGYTDFLSGMKIPANQDYVTLLAERQAVPYSDEAYSEYLESLVGVEPTDNVEPIDNVVPTEDIAPAKAYEAIEPKPQNLDALEKQWAKNKMSRVDSKKSESEKIASVLDTEPVTESDRNNRKWAIFKANVLDKGAVFEDLALKNRNRELMGKWNYTLYSESRAQRLMGNGDTEAGVKPLNDIRAQVESTGLTKQFYEYIYHKHNVDRMSLESREAPNRERLEKEIARLKLDHLTEEQLHAIAKQRITDKTTSERQHLIDTVKEYLKSKGVKNLPVFGYSVTSDVSQEIVNQYEFSNPEFMDYAKDVYNYQTYLRQQLVDSGVISQETADLWQKMYPHYVPIRRVDGSKASDINVPLDTGRTGINAPIKRATGGNTDILPLFDTMAMRTLQTYKATAKNSFGVELKNTLGTTVENKTSDVDEVIDSIDAQEGLLQEGKNGRKPTFTVFENGERITFEITDDMYDAFKPISDSSMLSKTIKPLNMASNIHRGVLTEYNPVFILTNGIKDIQDVLINSQHAVRTYAKIPEALAQLTTKGYWYNEYMNNGGDSNSYFDSDTGTFKTENKGLAKILDLPPFSTISKLNNYVEMIPRLAEYIASRETGRSVEVSMLDSARVTTNFRAGGDFTKFLNRNGATFLNASVQGAMQQVRNVREAKANGLKGWANLATKFAVAGAPAFLLNALLWDDDDDYEELSDYVKQNYYIVGKYDDGKFIRIPKGRTVAVIQDAMKQISDVATGNDEADLASFLQLVVTNLAPANPIENNIIAPIIQAKNNETWYGDDLVPTRLADLPASEQYDESTDSISKWLGEKLNISPVKINYLLDQYSGGVGDVVLPMLTPEAESGDNSVAGNIIAPLKKKFTVDSVMNNQNVTDFYETSEELTTNAKMSTATDEDVLQNKYINSVKAEMSDLYKKKREIQNSNMPDAEKYAQVREIQGQIVELSKEGLKSHKGVNISGDYATVGDRHYKRNDEGEWTKLTDKQLEKQEEVTAGLGINPSDYWSDKEEYDYAYEKPEKYAMTKALGGYDSYKSYTSELKDIKADKDESGKSISGSRKEKVLNYVDGLNADYGEKIILFKSEYPADDTYNEDIIEYLNNREDISYSEMELILKELGFTVGSDGTISW